MSEIIPSTTDASVEKHIPIYKVENNKVYVNVGSVEHPMTDDHYIEWISLQTNAGNQRKFLKPNSNDENAISLEALSRNKQSAKIGNACCISKGG